MKILDNGTVRDSTDLLAADRLIKMKTTHGVWDVIDECFRIWSSRNPKEYRSFLINVDMARKTRKDSKFASVHDKKNDAYLRYTLDIPEAVVFMIRCLYTPQELEMDRKFYMTLARKFPKLKVAEKI